MTWHRAWSISLKKGGCEPEGRPEAAAPTDDPRPTGRLGHRAGAGHMHAALGAPSRADPLRQLGAAGGAGKQRDRGGAVGCVAADARWPADRWHAVGAGADLSE